MEEANVLKQAWQDGLLFKSNTGNPNIRVKILEVYPKGIDYFTKIQNPGYNIKYVYITLRKNVAVTVDMDKFIRDFSPVAE
jgi:hypothetical protein